MPFLDSEKNSEKGFKLPDGVTSVSLDPHKYGLSSKGASISLFYDEKYRNCHLFTTIYWPGGLYGTPGFAGSRSGTPIAASWISMMKMGEEGYRKSAKQVQDGKFLFKFSHNIVSNRTKKIRFQRLWTAKDLLYWL